MSAFTIDLTGGPPWGFSMQGGSDFNQALNISKVTTGGKAALKGIRPNLVILRVNGQDVTQLRHIDAVQFVKQISRSGSLSLTLEAGYIRQADDLNVVLGEVSTVPEMYRSEAESDVIEYRKIDHNESKRRIFDDSASSGEQWKPDAYKSTQQSPSFNAVKAPSANGTPDAPVKPVYQPPTAKVAAPVPQSKPAVKTFEPAVRSSPTFAKSPTPSAPAPVAAQHQPQPATFDLSNPQASGVMRLPTVNFGSKGNQDKKSNAIGNLSSFMNKKSGGGVASGTLGKPDFLQGLVDRECPVGEPCVLEVRLAGSAPITVQWYHNNKPVKESIEKDIRLLQKGNIYTLVYGELGQRELGRYTCQASNNKGTVTSSCTIVEGGYDDDDVGHYPTATFHHGPSAPANPAYSKSVTHQDGALPARTKVVTKKPLNQLVTSGNANLYSNNAIEEGLHSALGIESQNPNQHTEESAVLAEIEGRSRGGPKQSSRTMAMLEQHLEDL